jgi:serine/threonine protein kinase
MLQDEAESVCSGPFRAPELYDVETNSRISTECDVWSLGCTIYAMTLGMYSLSLPNRTIFVQDILLLLVSIYLSIYLSIDDPSSLPYVAIDPYMRPSIYPSIHPYVH